MLSSHSSQWVCFSQLSKLLELLKETTIRRLGHLPWLDEESREKALKKVSKIEGRFLAPPRFFNESWVDKALAKVRGAPPPCLRAVLLLPR